ncbi:MAG: NfeD family protein [Sporichthyaceae bacterium]
MDAWVWWLIAAAVLGVVEILTLDLVFAMLAGGALVAAAAAGAGASAAAAGAIGLVAALAGLVALRPVALRHLKSTPELRTGTAALVGTQGRVLAEVGPGGGEIKLAGEIWSARAYDGLSVFEAGTEVSVLAIDGATALVG